MQNSSKHPKNQIHSNTQAIFDLKYPSQHQETFDLVQNINYYKLFDFLEEKEPLYGSNNINKDFSYLESLLEIDTPETLEVKNLIESLPKLEKPLFLTKKIKRKMGNGSDFCDEKETRKRKAHKKSAFDNILTKIQVHFLNFVINLCNDALKLIIKDNKQYFRPINYKFKRNISYDNFNKLKCYPMRLILSQEISNKFKSVKKSINSDVLNKVIPLSQWLNDFYNINCINAFSIYYNNCKPLKKINFKGKEIVLSQKTKCFNNLLKKNKVLKDIIIRAAQAAYFNGNQNLTEKFLIIKSNENNKKKINIV